MQRFPQAPQLLTSLCVSTHIPLQSCLGAAQVGTQAPAVHDCPIGHARPHAPQLLGSVCVSTQAPPQTCRGAGQGT